MPTYPRYDNAAPDGDWPGGVRYGFQRERVLKQRDWTDVERAAAGTLRLTLPEQCWAFCESWWDLPEPHITEVESPPSVGWYSAVDFPTVPGIMAYRHRHTVRTAQRYARIRWEALRVRAD